MRWVYILECEDNYFYVGETKRLFKRFWEHGSGNGGLNTSLHAPINIVAIYKLNKMGKFFDYAQQIKNNDYGDNFNIYFNRKNIIDDFNLNDEDTSEFMYDNLQIENCIIEKLMISYKDDWLNFRGGKYTNPNCNYDFPTNDLVTDLPMCCCGFPCDVNKNEDDNSLYFRCAKKNMWDGFKQNFEIDDEPCNYYKKFDDTNYRNNLEVLKNKLEKTKQTVFELTKKSQWLENLSGNYYEFCVGGCNKRFNENYTIRYNKKAINLCFDCFIQKNDELKSKFKYDENMFEL